MAKEIPRFYNSIADFNVFYMRLKLVKCPFCRLVGCLILHGYLHGYDENKDSECIRGRRIFCSNRNRRSGCGKTFSILKSLFLKFFRLQAVTLWTFIKGLLAGKTKKAAWQSTGIQISESFLYGVARRLTVNKSHIRTRLYTLEAHKASCQNSIFHQLKQLFNSGNPISAFQYYFQDDFLRHRPAYLTI